MNNNWTEIDLLQNSAHQENDQSSLLNWDMKEVDVHPPEKDYMMLQRNAGWGGGRIGECTNLGWTAKEFTCVKIFHLTQKIHHWMMFAKW